MKTSDKGLPGMLIMMAMFMLFANSAQAQQSNTIVYSDTTGKIYSSAEIQSLSTDFFFLKQFPLKDSFTRNDTSFRVLDLFGLLDAMNYHVAGEDIRDLYIGKPFPWHGFVNGRKLDTTAFKGKIVQVNIWATTCGPCIAEFPDLNRLARDYEPKGVSFISICEEPQDSVDKLLKVYPFSFTHLVDAYADLRKYYFDIFPTNILIGKDGLVQSIHLGTQTRKLPGKEREFVVYEKYAPLLDELLAK